MTLDELEEAIRELSDRDLGYLRACVNTLWENRIRFIPGLTFEEQEALKHDALNAVKMVRNRTGLGLRDAKELVDRWRAGWRPDGGSKP